MSSLANVKFQSPLLIGASSGSIDFASRQRLSAGLCTSLLPSAITPRTPAVISIIPYHNRHNPHHPLGRHFPIALRNKSDRRDSPLANALHLHVRDYTMPPGRTGACLPYNWLTIYGIYPVRGARVSHGQSISATSLDYCPHRTRWLQLQLPYLTAFNSDGPFWSARNRLRIAQQTLRERWLPTPLTSLLRLGLSMSSA